MCCVSMWRMWVCCVAFRIRTLSVICCDTGLLCLGDVQQAAGAVVPVVKHAFPSSANDPTVKTIPQFCFPSVEDFPRSKMRRCGCVVRALRGDCFVDSFAVP